MPWGVAGIRPGAPSAQGDGVPAVLEAGLAHGVEVLQRHVLGHRVGAAEDVATPRGHVADPLSDLEIADAIEDILNPETYESYRNNIIKNTHVHKWEDIAQEFLDLYDKL